MQSEELVLVNHEVLALFSQYAIVALLTNLWVHSRSKFHCWNIYVAGWSVYSQKAISNWSCFHIKLLQDISFRIMTFWSLVRSSQTGKHTHLKKSNSILLTRVAQWVNPLTTNRTKWSNTLKQFVGNSWRIVWVFLTILWVWCLKGQGLILESKLMRFNAQRALVTLPHYDTSSELRVEHEFRDAMISLGLVSLSSR